MARRTCTRCPAIIDKGTNFCPDCAKAADAARGDSTARGYGAAHRTRFRPGVLARDPVCKLCLSAMATVADHWPLSRRDLEARGLDPDDPANGRGLCKPCHDRETARNQPGGWHQPT